MAKSVIDKCISELSEREAPVIISGFLKKMRRQISFYTPTWDKRWVVIQNGAISWRHSKQSETAGFIPLSQVEDVYKIAPLKRNSSNESGKIFVVKSKKRRLCLSAADKDECDKWFRVIQLQLDLNGGGKHLKNRGNYNGGRDKYEVSTSFPSP